MDNHSLPKSRIVGSILCAALSVVGSILMTVAFATEYENGTNYFSVGAILPTAAIVVAILAAMIGSVTAFISPVSREKKNNNLPFASVFAGIGFMVCGAKLLTSAESTFETISALLLVLAAFYCILDVSRAQSIQSAIFYFGFASVLGCASLTGVHYFDNTVEMNAPAKVLLQIGLLLAMLFFTGELRYRLGQPTPRIYCTICVWTVSAGSIASVPVIIAYLMGKIDRIDYLLTALLLLGITITVALRLYTVFFTKDTQEEEPTESPVPPTGTVL